MEPVTDSKIEAIKWNVHSIIQKQNPERLKIIAKKLCLPVQLMLFNLDGNMNIAMSIRTASVLGCSDVWVIGRRKWDARPEVGAKNYINVHKQTEFNTSYFKENGIQPVLVEQGGVPIEDINFKPFMHKKICFIVGSESNGIPKDFMNELKDAPRVTISQYGVIRSLNVSIAASIVMYEYLRQWRKNRLD
jgi:tRNA(Leu) C34 or U34 (ribose-2'-O)-methylase TrmL